jgi:deoxyribonuclease-4
MPRFGAHFSIAGGLQHAAETAQSLRCETFQLFTKNANQWKAAPLTDEAVRTFRDAVTQAKCQFVTAHDSYLINLAAPGDELFDKSVDAFVVELERAEALGLSYLVTHPGAHVGSGDAAGLQRVVQGLNAAAERCAGFQVQVLLETTAGQGTTLGHRFEHLAFLLQNVRHPERYGVCLDTCHIFAAGYPLGTVEEYESTFEEFDRVVGLNHLKVFHVNDSVKPLGSRVDRHAGLELGQIGKTAFRMLATDPRFADHPMILETPKEGDEGEEMDPVNLKKLRGYRRPK